MSEVLCPQCKNPIHDEDALSCHFCGGSLCRTSGGAFGALRGAGMKWVWITVGLIMLAAFVLTMF